MKMFYSKDDFTLYNADCNDILGKLNKEVDMVFADPPYFLSNDGLTIKNGKVTSVNKGNWDKLENETTYDFNLRWLSNVKNIIKKNGTIWISGTAHNIYTIFNILLELDFKILNTIIWEKTNPPPNFSCRVFTHSTEIIIWARKSKNTSHYFNYDLMKLINKNKQMKDVWRFPATPMSEKKHGKHPTQKPLSVLSRIILSSTKTDEIILDPFTGSSTTGIAAYLFDRKFIGIDKEKEFLELSIKRKEEIKKKNKQEFISNILGIGKYMNH